MFNFETLVKISVMLSIATGGTFSFATQPVYAPAPPNNDRAWDDYNRRCRDANKEDTKDCKEKLKLLYNPSGGGIDDCKSENDAFIKAKTDFSDACAAANLGDSCAEDIVKCEEKDSEDRKDNTPRKRDTNKPLDVNAAKDLYEKCPSRAGEDLDKYEKQLKEQEEKVKKLKAEVPELEEKANKVLSATNEKLTQIKVEMTDKQKKLAEDLQKITEEKDGAEKAITEQVTAIAAQIAKAQDAIGEVSVTKLEGQLKLKQTKIQADLNCHASATAQVSKMQTDVLAASNMGTYNRSGFAGLLKNVGLSDRQQWERVARKYYQWCLDSKPTLDTKDGANDGFKLLVAHADKSEASMREQVKQLQAQQRTLSGSGPCSGQPTPQANGSNGGETALCQNVRKSIQKSNQLVDALKADEATLKDKYTTQEQQGTREYQKLENQARTKNAELKAEEARLDNLKQYVQAKYDVPGASNADGKVTAKAGAKRNNVIQNGIELMVCKGKNSPIEDGDFCTGSTDSSCLSIKTYLQTEMQYKNEERLKTIKTTHPDTPHPDPLEVESRVNTNDSESLTPSVGGRGGR